MVRPKTDPLLDSIALPLSTSGVVTCPVFFEPIIPGRRLGWGWGDVAA
jgi:hypothetical protein